MIEKLYLSINDIEFKQICSKAWWCQKNYIENVLKIVYDSKILPFNYYDTENERFKPIASFYEVLTCFKTLGSKKSVFHISKDKDSLVNSLKICLYEEGFGFTLGLSKISDLVLEKLTNLFWQIYDLLKKEAYFGPRIGIFPCYYEYPRRRLMKNYKWLGQASFINFIQPVYYERNKQLKLEGGHNLLCEDLPEGVARTKKESVYAIRWVKTIEDAKIARQAMMTREDWCLKHLKLDPAVNFNIYGDKKVFSIKVLQDVSKEESFISYYDDISFNEAYAAYILDKDSSISNEIKKKIEYYLKIKRLDSGRPIEKLGLITSNREQALAIDTQAKHLGCFKVFYLDEQIYLWDLNPEGDWRDAK